MSIIKKVDQSLESTGDERSFLWLLYNYITGLWSGITCKIILGDGTVIDPADPDDMVWTNNAKIDIIFTLKENVTLRFQIYIGASMGVDMNRNMAYNTFVELNEATIATIGSEGGNTRTGSGLQFAQSSTWPKYNANATRRYRVSKYISDNTFIIWFGDFNKTSWKNSNLFIMGIKDTSNNWHYSAGSNIDTAVFYDLEGSSAAKSPMFSYEARTGYLDFISHSSFITGGTKAFTSTDIYDCTTVNFGDTLSLKDGANFLAIGAHSMVRLDEEG